MGKGKGKDPASGVLMLERCGRGLGGCRYCNSVSAQLLLSYTVLEYPRSTTRGLCGGSCTGALVEHPDVFVEIGGGAISADRKAAARVCERKRALGSSCFKVSGESAKMEHSGYLLDSNFYFWCIFFVEFGS